MSSIWTAVTGFLAAVLAWFGFRRLAGRRVDKRQEQAKAALVKALEVVAEKNRIKRMEKLEDDLHKLQVQVDVRLKRKPTARELREMRARLKVFKESSHDHISRPTSNNSDR